MKSTLRTVARHAAVLGVLVTAFTLAPAARAAVRVGFDVKIALPAGVHVTVGNYEPYYVGRVFYRPLGVWRPVYSFPVRTSVGIVYRPYVYDGGRVIYRDRIPGPESGYGSFVREGRGHYDARWRPAVRYHEAHHPGHGHRAFDHARHHGRAHR